MATLTETQDVYDRHNLHVGTIHSAVADVILGLEAQLAWSESELGTAQAEIARLEDALRHAARMYTIKGARKIVATALGEVEYRRNQ